MMKKYRVVVKAATCYNPPVDPHLPGTRVGDVILCWKSNNEDDMGRNLVCIQLPTGEVVERSISFCRMHLEYI